MSVEDVKKATLRTRMRYMKARIAYTQMGAYANATYRRAIKRFKTRWRMGL